MRISDWSSDVCSSDLLAHGGGQAECGQVAGAAPAQLRIVGNLVSRGGLVEQQRFDVQAVMAEHVGERRKRLRVDRKSVVEGKSVSVRVDLGGRRIINQKHNKHTRHKKTHLQYT